MDLFVFGTLLSPSVMGRYVHRRPVSAQAQLPGYRRVRIACQPYPALLVAPRCSVQGRLVRGLSPREVAALDDYEGSEYYRAPVRVVLSGGQGCLAQVYLTRPYLLPRLLWQDWVP